MATKKSSCFDCPAKAKSIFSDLSEFWSIAIDELRAEQTWKAGEALSFRPQDGNASQKSDLGFYCVRSGHLKLGVSPTDPESKPVRIGGPGDLVGYAGPSKRQNSEPAYSAVALDSVSACFFRFDEFQDLQNSSTEVSNGLVRMLCRELEFKDERIIGLENHSVKNRVAALLHSLNSKFGSKNGKVSRIDVKVDRRTLALLSGTVSQTLGRVLTELEDDKIILREGRSICVLDAQRLHQVAVDGR